jgi:hypothetical protein
LIKRQSQVLFDHVDLRVADREGGFAASFTSYGATSLMESQLRGKTGTFGEIDVPRLNIAGSAIVGSIAVLIFIVVSCIRGFNATEAVVEHYDALKAMHEQCTVDGDGDGNVKVVDDDVDVVVEGGGVKN